VAVGVRPGERRRWAVWDELMAPDLVIELLSDSTRAFDLTEKRRIYQDYLRVPESICFDPFTAELMGWSLREGHYEPLAPDEEDRLPSRVLGLRLVLWRGTYQDIEATWLRWTTADGILLPTAEELAQEARSRAELAESRAAELAERLSEAERRLSRGHGAT
jgi:hypothetical protein